MRSLPWFVVGTCLGFWGWVLRSLWRDRKARKAESHIPAESGHVGEWWYQRPVSFEEAFAINLQLRAHHHAPGEEPRA